MLPNVLLRLLLQLHLIPVIFERHHSVYSIRELRHQEQRVYCVDEVLVANISGTVAIEDRVADAPVPVDVRMVDRSYEACGRCKERVIAAHVDLEQERASNICTLRGACNIVSAMVYHKAIGTRRVGSDLA